MRDNGELPPRESWYKGDEDEKSTTTRQDHDVADDFMRLQVAINPPPSTSSPPPPTTYLPVPLSPYTPPPFKASLGYLTPLLLLYDEPSHIFACYRVLSHRFFAGLNVISSVNENSILPLSQLFESLLHTASPGLYAHLLSLGVYPLKVAFPWIHLSFTTFMPIEQLLILYDRIIAHQSLSILPILAAAIFCYREEALMECRSEEDVEMVFDWKGEGGRRLKVIPLLQGFLFPDYFKE
jgi:hypothetical protein